MNWWTNLRALWPGALRQHITRTGLAYSGTIVVVAIVAVLSGNNLMFLILAAMLSILFVSGFVSKLVLAGLEVDLLLPPHISARRLVRAKVHLKNLKRWMPSFSILLQGAPDSGFEGSLYYPVVAGGAALEEPIDLFFPVRGRHAARTFSLTTRFPFGFAERREMVSMHHDVTVYPCLDPRPEFQELLHAVTGELEAWRRGQGHDFYRIRPYEAMESARHVDWKATAHTNSLQVREFAHSDDRAVLIYLDLDVPRTQEAWFESAVECTAFLAFHLAESGHRVRLRTQDIDLMTPSQGDVYTILGYLALVSPRRGAPPGDPDSESLLQIVFSADPDRMALLGWGSSSKARGQHAPHIVGPDAFSPLLPLNGVN